MKPTEQEDEDAQDLHLQVVHRHLPLIASVLQPMALLLIVFSFLSPSWLAWEAPKQVIIVSSTNTTQTPTNDTLTEKNLQIKSLVEALEQSRPRGFQFWIRQDLDMNITETIDANSSTTTLETSIGNITIISSNNTLLNSSTVTHSTVPVFTTGPVKHPLMWILSLGLVIINIFNCWTLWRRLKIGSCSPQTDGTLQKLGIASGFIASEQEQEVELYTQRLITWSVVAGGSCIALTMLYNLFTPLTSPGWSYSDAYYNCLQSGILSVASATIFFFDRTWTGDAFGRLGSGLSMTQTKCLLAIISTMCFMSLVAALFSQLENWDYRDSMFFIITTFTTIGFGAGVSPKTSLARLSLIPISLAGIALVGFTITNISLVIDEAIKEGIRLQWTEVRMRRERGDTRQVLYQVLDDGNQGQNRRRWWQFWIKPEPVEDVEMASGNGVPQGELQSVPVDSLETLNAVPTIPIPPTEEHSDALLAKNLAKRHLYHDLIMAILVLLTFWFSASLVFSLVEKWSFDQSLYFVFVSMATIGYGDIVPATPQGLALFNIFIFLAIGVVTWCVSIVALYYKKEEDLDQTVQQLQRLVQQQGWKDVGALVDQLQRAIAERQNDGISRQDTDMGDFQQAAE